MDKEYEIVRDVVENDDGSKICFDKLCDKYGLSIQVTISRYNKYGEIIGKPIILHGI